MTRHETRLFAQTFIVGILCTLAVAAAQLTRLLKPFDEWLYDERAFHVQFAAPPPSKQIAHLDIDDASLDAIGRWPWPRARLARILDEVHLANPSAVGLDILLPEPQDPLDIIHPDGTVEHIDNDGLLAASLHRLGVAVMAASFDLSPDEGTWPMLSRVEDLYKKNLELTIDEVHASLGSQPTNFDAAPFDDLCTHARRLAMRERLDAELHGGHVDLPTLLPRLLPHTDPTIDSPLTRLLSKQYVIATATQAISRFGGPNVPMTPPPLKGELAAVPLTAFCEAAADCGFANYDIFDNATVQSIPLFIQYKDKLYPQIGMAVACVAAGADPRAARFDGHTIILPTKRGPITIPTFVYHSRTLGQDVPLIAAVPWFGTDNWQAMYDYPAHKNSVAHVSIVLAWDICLTNDLIRRNNAQIDRAIAELLDDENPDQLQIDAKLARRYAKQLPDPMDCDTRATMVETTLKEVKATGFVEMYDAMSAKDLRPVDIVQRDNLRSAINTLNTAIANNRDAQKHVNDFRRQLSDAIGGKAVFIGFTATGFEDKVSTSLHLHCPGVVVHGVIANAVLTGAWWHVSPPWVALCLTLLLGVLTTSGQARLPPLRATLFAFGLALIYWIVNWYLLFGLERVTVNMAGPMAAILFVWSVCTARRVVIEGVERIRAATENEFFQREFSLARKVQFALVPKEAPEMPGINADGWTLPADMTGGDLFDLWKLPDGRLGILVADASGHGLAPAMIVSQVRTLVHMLSEYEPNPHSLLQRVNTRLARDLEPGRFVTAFLAFLKTDGEFEWASAGHGPMYWCPTGEGEMLELDSSGLPLGVQEDWLCDDPAPPLKMELTGRLVVFSDGIFEAHAKDPAAGLFGTQAIKDILHNACHASSTEIINSIRDAVQKWQGKPEPVDDQTIVVVRRVTHEEASTEPDAHSTAESEVHDPDDRQSAATVIISVADEFEVAVENPVLEPGHVPHASSD